MHWRRKWQPIPVFLPGESQGQAPVYGVAQSRTRLKWLSNLNKRKEKTLESLFDYKEIKPVNPKRNQPWIFIGKIDAEAEAPTLWPPDAKSQLTGKDPDAGKDWRQKEKGPAEDKMVGWHHWLSGHEFEQTLGDSGGETSLACWSPWGCKESGTTEWLNTTMKVLKTTWYPFIPL